MLPIFYHFLLCILECIYYASIKFGIFFFSFYILRSFNLEYDLTTFGKCVSMSIKCDITYVLFQPVFKLSSNHSNICIYIYIASNKWYYVYACDFLFWEKDLNRNKI